MIGRGQNHFAVKRAEVLRWGQEAWTEQSSHAVRASASSQSIPGFGTGIQMTIFQGYSGGDPADSELSVVSPRV